MRRLLAVNILCLVLACSSGGSNNDAAGSAGSGATAGTGGSGSGSAGTTGGAGTTGTAGNSGTTGSSGRGGASGGTTGTGGTGGIKCLAFDSPGLVRGLACPNTTPPCYANCDFDGDQYVGCISGSTDFSECFPSCGACP
jgi:hypothetical protein